MYIFLVIEIIFAMNSSAFQALKSPCFERSRQNSHAGITQSNFSTLGVVALRWARLPSAVRERSPRTYTGFEKAVEIEPTIASWLLRSSRGPVVRFASPCTKDCFHSASVHPVV